MPRLALPALALAAAPLGAQSTDTTGSRPSAPPAVAPAPSPVTVTNRGIVFTSADRKTRITMRFRIQNLAQFRTQSTDDLSIRESNLAVRRLRLRFDGSMLDPRLEMKLQLSFSRGDQDFADTGFPDIVRDAAVYWRFSPHVQAGFGQTKLPGNRQRVNSSSQMQFAERAIVNNRFNVDRDFGFFLFTGDTVGGRPVIVARDSVRRDSTSWTVRADTAWRGGVEWRLQGAVSSGEGRNSTPGDDGLAYTARAELLPFGPFLRGNDEWEGDIVHEPWPRLSVGMTASRNVRARRTGGQLGPALYSPVSMTTWYADALFKYQGLALYGEYAKRTTSGSPVTTQTSGTTTLTRFVYAGDGWLAQGSYHVRRADLEPVVRLSWTMPVAAIAGLSGAERQAQHSVGLVRYLNQHRVKVMGEVGWNRLENAATRARTSNYFLRFNTELGI
jgi:hypothetical protein